MGTAESLPQCDGPLGARPVQPLWPRTAGDGVPGAGRLKIDKNYNNKDGTSLVPFLSSRQYTQKDKTH